MLLIIPIDTSHKKNENRKLYSDVFSRTQMLQTDPTHWALKIFRHHYYHFFFQTQEEEDADSPAV